MACEDYPSGGLFRRVLFKYKTKTGVKSRYGD